MIPKTIHYCWLGGAPKPESVLKCIESWKQYCPDYEIKEWNESNLDLSANLYTKQAYELKKWGFVPDYLRLWVVYTYGGIYFDTDVQAVRNFDDLLKYPAFAGFETGSADEKGAFVNCGQGFGAEKGNRIIHEHMELYRDLRFINEDGSLNMLASPNYTTLTLEKYGLNRFSNTIQDLGDIVILPEDYLCPKSFLSGEIKLTQNTHSIHHFAASWLPEDKLHGIWDRWSFFEKRKKTIIFRLFNRNLTDEEKDQKLDLMWKRNQQKKKKRKWMMQRLLYYPKTIFHKAIGDKLHQKVKKLLRR